MSTYIALTQKKNNLINHLLSLGRAHTSFGGISISFTQNDVIAKPKNNQRFVYQIQI